VQELVKLHGGTIQAESRGIGQGTTLRVELPIPAVLSEPGVWLRRRVGAALPERTSLEGLTILVVDDEPQACEALRGILEQHGATVHVALSVAEAMKALEHITPSLLVSDLAMPGVDGLAFIRALRQGSLPARDVPAAALTAFAGADHEQTAQAAGFQLLLEKPVGPDELARQLARLARHRSDAAH
jgi:CheY-like chemotaxis protein